MKHLFDRIVEGGLELTIDGTPAYNEKAQFVGGKVINEACYVVLEFLKDEESFCKLGDVHGVRDAYGNLGDFTRNQRPVPAEKSGIIRKSG